MRKVFNYGMRTYH